MSCLFFALQAWQKKSDDLACVHLQPAKSEALCSLLSLSVPAEVELETKCFITNVKRHWENQETWKDKLFEKAKLWNGSGTEGKLMSWNHRQGQQVGICYRVLNTGKKMGKYFFKLLEEAIWLHVLVLIEDSWS